MKYILNPSQISNLTNFVQKFIDSELDIIRNESENWDMDMFNELLMIKSVDKIVVDDINVKYGINVYVNIYTHNDELNRDDYNSLIDDISYKLSLSLPNSDIFIRNIF